jgi:hypothetical protein
MTVKNHINCELSIIPSFEESIDVFCGYCVVTVISAKLFSFPPITTMLVSSNMSALEFKQIHS